MDGSQFTQFLQPAMTAIAAVSMDGAIAYVCMDWRHLDELSAAVRAAGLTQLNLVVWNKTSPGQGSFYLSQHELIFVLRVGSASPINAFGLGGHGRIPEQRLDLPGRQQLPSWPR